MNWESVADTAAAVCLVVGATLTFIAGFGVFRVPDLLSRQHVATKPQVLGLALMMAGVALSVREGVVVWTVLLVVGFQLLTSPISAHMLGRAGYRTGKVKSEELLVDEYSEQLESVRNNGG